MRLFVILTLISILTLSVANSQSCCASKNKTRKCHSSKDAPSAELSEMSLYNLSSEWTTSRGEAIKLEKLKGKIQIVTMIYTSCQYACPRIMADLKIIEKAIAKYGSEKVGIVLVTMDPERDTPEKLKAFASDNKLDKKRWTLLTAKESDVMEMAALLKVKYKKESTGDISHSNIITVLNSEGEVVNQQEGLGTDPEPTIGAIEKMLEKGA